MAIPQDRLRAREGRRPLTAAAVDTWRISWGGIWAGTLVGLGLLLLLTALGLAVGISAADLGKGQQFDAGAMGIGTAVWAGVSLLIALFVGGMVSSRVSYVTDRTTSWVHGSLVWVLVVFAIFYFASTGIGALTSGAFGLLGGLVRGAGAVAGAAGVGDIGAGTVDDIVARLNSTEVVQTVAAATGRSQEEVRSALAQIQQRVEAARQNPSQAAAVARQELRELLSGAGQQLQQAVGAAEPYAVATAWITFGVMIIALAAALGGAMVGLRSAGTQLREAAPPPVE
jgi:hypothetical protein